MTSMIPASLRLKKAGAQAKPKRIGPGLTAIPNAAPRIAGDSIEEVAPAAPGPSSSLVSSTRVISRPRAAFDSKYEDFMHEMADLGALET